MLINCLEACTQQFSSYSNRKFQKPPFSRTAAHIFVSPGDAPAIITQYVAWMERQFNACQTPSSMYVSIFNSFRVIRCLSQCVRQKKSLFLPHFCFLWGRPWVGRGRQLANSQRTFKAIQGPGHTVGGAFLRNPGHWNFTQAWHNDLIQTKVHTKPCWGHTFHLDKGPSQFSIRQQAHQTV